MYLKQLTIFYAWSDVYLLAIIIIIKLYTTRVTN